MTPRSLFTIIIKVFGLWLLLSVLSVVVRSLTTIVFTSFSGDSFSQMVVSVIVTLLVAGLYFLVLWLCFFRTGFIIDKLSLDKHFTQEKLDINISGSSVLRIAAIVTGGCMIIRALPGLVEQVTAYMQLNRVLYNDQSSQQVPYILASFAQLLIGYFLIAKNRSIASFIETKSSD